MIIACPLFLKPASDLPTSTFFPFFVRESVTNTGVRFFPKKYVFCNLKKTNKKTKTKKLFFLFFLFFEIAKTCTF